MMSLFGEREVGLAVVYIYGCITICEPEAFASHHLWDNGSTFFV